MNINPRSVWAPVAIAVNRLFEEHVTGTIEYNRLRSVLSEERMLPPSCRDQARLDALKTMSDVVREENHQAYIKLSAINLILGGDIANFRSK